MKYLLTLLIVLSCCLNLQAADEKVSKWDEAVKSVHSFYGDLDDEGVIDAFVDLKVKQLTQEGKQPPVLTDKEVKAQIYLEILEEMKTVWLKGVHRELYESKQAQEAGTKKILEIREKLKNENK